MKLDLHIHSNHSFDCESNIKDIVKCAEQSGLSAIAFCDHDNMSAHSIARKITKKLIIIPGMEITTRGGTHIIGLFLKEEIISRDIFEVIDEIHNQDGLVVIPHPYRPGTGLIYNREKQNIFTGDEMVKIMSTVDLIESINYRSTQDNLIDTDRFLSFHPDKPQIAGSDAHYPDEVGKARLELEHVNSNSLDDIKKALLKSPRTIRYEAFNIDTTPEVKTLVVKKAEKSFSYKTGKLLPPFIKNSIKALYKRSSKILSGVKGKG
jgi:predicted metal-dependent phosphoesterase TrpH